MLSAHRFQQVELHQQETIAIASSFCHNQPSIMIMVWKCLIQKTPSFPSNFIPQRFQVIHDSSSPTAEGKKEKILS
jgi:hypothetical protein